MPTWNELFEMEEFRWREPHEIIVELAESLGKGDGRRVLDLGCGAGRHLVYLAGRGFRVTGLDRAMNGLLHARDWLAREGLAGSLACADMVTIPCASAAFDLVISTFVLYHNRLEGIRRSIAEVERVLRPGGLALLTFPSRRSGRYGRGKEIEPHTFISDVGDDAGLPHHYSDLEELGRELQAFIIRRIVLDEHPSESGGIHSHWEVLLEKPSTPI